VYLGGLGPGIGRIRYALYRSYVLLEKVTIEHISEQFRAQDPRSEAQRIEEVAYESPALPLSYSATVVKITERDSPQQPPPLQHITIEQHITLVAAAGFDSATGRSPNGASPRLAGMSDRREREVDDASLVVDAVPDPPRARHFVLARLERVSFMRSRGLGQDQVCAERSHVLPPPPRPAAR